MKKNQNDAWPSEFYFESITEDSPNYFSRELLEDSIEELSKIYQKENKKSKIPKKAKQAWQ